MSDETPLGPGAEFDLIRRILAGRSADRPDVRVGPGDDCAVVAGDGIAVSSDLSIEDVHFRRDWLSPDEIGWRAAAGALSDLAAMAARPIGVLASIAAPEADVPDFAEALMAGVAEAANSTDAALLGGDVVRSPGPFAVDVVVVGEAPDPVRRGGAREGDAVWVTGRLGGPAAAVAAWLDGRAPAPSAREAFARPRPRTAEALWLRDRVPIHAMIDLSDGLASDAAHLAAASGVGIVLEPGRVPVHEAAEGADGERLALTGGEDYELCFVSPPEAVEGRVREFEKEFGVMMTRVGTVGSGGGVKARRADGSTAPLGGGWQHFGGEE